MTRQTLRAAGFLLVWLLFVRVEAGEIINPAPQCAPLTSITTAVGNVGGGEDDLITYSLPANTLDSNGNYLRVTAWGTTAGNANNKTSTIYFGATSLASGGPTGANNRAWHWTAKVIRTGATAQEAIARGEWDANVNPSSMMGRTTPSENTAGTITIKTTGTATDTDDIVQRGMIVELCRL